MSYIRFGMMIVTSTLVMFLLMYLNTYAWEHVYFSETRVYMAILMGATMAIIMLAYMYGMYADRKLNIAIFTFAVAVFALSLWLVRSQATVSGPSYMRAMIPHHSIAIMTSERAGIRDQRVRKLADEIIEAQRREIAEMQYLIGDIGSGRVVESVFEDPPATPGTVDDALNNTLIARLDLSSVTEDEANQAISGEILCTFSRSPESDPILWISESGTAAAKLNGILLRLNAIDTKEEGTSGFSAPGIDIVVNTHGEDADWRSNAELVFGLDQGLSVGYRGFNSCDA